MIIFTNFSSVMYFYKYFIFRDVLVFVFAIYGVLKHSISVKYLTVICFLKSNQFYNNVLYYVTFCIGSRYIIASYHNIIIYGSGIAIWMYLNYLFGEM